MSEHDWRAVAGEQGGAITRRQMIDCGLSASAVTRLTRRGDITLVGWGVYLVAGAPRTYHARLWQAVLATHGVLGGVTAGELWGLVSRRTDQIHVIVSHDRRIKVPPGVTVRRWRDERVPRCERDRLPVTTARWTAMSLLAGLPPWEASRLADRALQRGWITRSDVMDRLHRYPHRRGNPQLRALVDATSDGAAAESERRLHRILRRAGIAGWEPNYPVWVDGELIAVVDVALIERRIAIEVDGMAYHVDVDAFRHDRRRQNDLIALGWRVIRFTWADLTERPDYVQHAVGRVLAQPQTGLGSVWSA